MHIYSQFPMNNSTGLSIRSRETPWPGLDGCCTWKWLRKHKKKGVRVPEGSSDTILYETGLSGVRLFMCVIFRILSVPGDTAPSKVWGSKNPLTWKLSRAHRWLTSRHQVQIVERGGNESSRDEWCSGGQGSRCSLQAAVGARAARAASAPCKQP